MRLSHELGDILERCDTVSLRQWILRNYQKEITDCSAIGVFKRARILSGSGRKQCFDADWGGWIVWIKDQVGGIPFGDNSHSTLLSHTTAELNVFFINIEETASHIGRLKNEHFSSLDSTARSKVVGFLGQLNPIDTVAARVGPEEFRNCSLENLVSLSSKSLPADLPPHCETDE